MSDDDYWNTSETKAKAFSFDDDVVNDVVFSLFMKNLEIQKKRRPF